MSFKRSVKLSTSVEIPLLGLGTAQCKPGETDNAIKVALKAGYRHLDCAWFYGNEEEIGPAIKASGVPREEIFITSKLWNIFHHPDRVEKALDESLQSLQLEYLDLYLIHWPISQPSGEENTPKNEDGTLKLETGYSIADTWKVLEAMVKKGKVKNIGVSNFTIKRLKEVMDIATIKPAVNQVELHPYLPQHELLEFCKKENIHITGYGPLGGHGNPRVLEDPKIVEIANRLGKSPAQVILSWNQLCGCSVIPKSVTDSRIKENFEDIKLDSKDMEVISTLDKEHRFYILGTGTFD